MLKRFNRLLALTAALFTAIGLQAEMPEGANRTAPPTVGGDKNAIVERATRRRTLANAREGAAARQQKALKAKGGKIDPAILGQNPANAPKAAKAGALAPGAKELGLVVPPGTGTPGLGFQLQQPDYMFGTASNWHNTKPIRKFIDGLPGLGSGNANNLGNYIPLATNLTPGDPNSDYYEIDVVEYKQQLHSELAPTRLRGYQNHNASFVNGSNAVNYLGPVIIAKRDRPVRVKMFNQLPTGVAGDLFIPVDTTMMGAGVGPLGGTELYTQNRAEFHLHGGLNPWISDGTPHQWVTPAGEVTSYKKGAAFANVPDMAAGATDGDGIATYYYTNQQSGRFMFYHDHSFGLTRLNVYAGEAAGYMIVDPVEDKLINAGILPNQGGGVYNYGIPLIIQDKTFVNTATLGQIGVQGGTDPTWDVNKYGGDGSLWYPHVYMVNQNPADISGANGMGRWDYAAWFWPPYPLAINNNGIGLQHGAEPIIGDPNGTEYPGTPNPSLVPEGFMDTPLVNGTPYPTITVDPKAYRFRILNAANDRFWSLSFFQADASGTEVSMVDAVPTNPTFPAGWPTDGRDGGVPDPLTAGPSFIQIGNESGFLPAPTVIAPQPIGYNYNRRDIVVLSVQEKALFMGPAERADVIVDFSAYAGKTLILYNDAPAPVPAFDVRFDYYTGMPDNQATGGSVPTVAGYGPNTRTIMQFVVSAGTPAPFDLAALNAAFQSTPTTAGAFAEAQHIPIVPQNAYNTAMGKVLTPAEEKLFANDVYVRIQDTKVRMPFPSTENGDLIQPVLQPKAIQELFELDYGRMNATLGVELPLTNFANQTTIPLGYADPATENLTDGTTQYWKITHNGVDTHPVHFHLFDVQVINRVGWDGAVRMPDANEVGWKETLRMNPLEDIIVAFRPLSPRLPFVLPFSMHAPDVTKAVGAPVSWTSPTTGNAVAGFNNEQNFQWEYVWHCHILGHEENDFMRPMVLTVATTVPADPTLLTATLSGPSRAELAWTDNATNETGYTIQRRTGANAFATIATAVPNVRTFSDLTVLPGTNYDYQVIAYNQAGDSAPSNIAGVGTAATIQVSGMAFSFDGLSNLPLAGVTLTFSNGGGTATSDATGAYSATVPLNWAGTVTPTLAGFAFTPLSRTFAALSANQTGQDFVARTANVTISGNVKNGATNLAGATLTASTGETTTTDASGNYSFTLPNPYTGTITPTLAGYSFAPVSRTYATIGANQTAQDFAATSIVSVSGQVTLNAVGLAGVTLTFSTGQTVATAADGTYTITLPRPYTGTLTAAKAGYFITPLSLSFAAINTNQVAQNFTAVNAIAVYGLITTNAVPPLPLSGVTVTFSNGAGSVVTDASGLYTHYVPSPYSGSITPSLAGYVFTPVLRNLTNITASPAGQNFTAGAVYAVSGTITTNGTPLAGVRVAFSNSGGLSVLTAANGTYTLNMRSGWTGNLTPTLRGYQFSPANAIVTVPLAGALTQNFTTVQTITGRARDLANGNSIPGVTITATTGQTAVTDANGNFTLRVPTGFTGTITASGGGFTTWAPVVGFSYTNLVTNVTGLRFIGN